MAAVWASHASNTLKSVYGPMRYRWLPTTVHAWRNLFGRTPMAFIGLDYDEYWAGNHSQGSESDARVATFARLIEPASRVLEMGCGDGTLLAVLRERLGATVKGYDISARAVEKARQRGVDAEVRDVMTCGWGDGAPYDYVIIADCLEHLACPEAVLDGLRGGVRKAILLSVPNSCYWRYRFRVLRGSFMVQWVAHPGEHLRFWSISDMRWWLGELGYTARAALPTWGVPLLKHVWPAMFARNVIFVVTEAPGRAGKRECRGCRPVDTR